MLGLSQSLAQSKFAQPQPLSHLKGQVIEERMIQALLRTCCWKSLVESFCIRTEGCRNWISAKDGKDIQWDEN